MLFRLAALPIVAATVVAGAQQPPPGVTIKPVLDNATLAVSKLTLAPGAREPIHAHPHPLLVVILTRGEVEMHNGPSHTKGAKAPGDVEYVAAGVPHAGANVGTTPVQGLVLALKPDRPHGGTAPPPQSLPGLTRTPVLDNADLTVTRLAFEEDVREALHTHPYDLLVLPITPARLDLQLGMSKEVRGYAVGEAVFIPRSVPHAAANVGTSPFKLLGIAIK
jgi:quercetin dioxygenase-like cupin family protein